MKLEEYFDTLLADTVNLPQSKLDLLASRSKSVHDALVADLSIGDNIIGYTVQGSWAQRTIINPVGGKEFDADILLNMNEVPDWEPKDYIEQVYWALDRHATYASMPHRRRCRCVTLTYANSMHIDIVPHLILSDEREVITNRDENEWETTDPDGFTQWMKNQDEACGGNLRKVIRLVKFLRDHRNSFTGTPSIIITTLLGNQALPVGQILGYYTTLPDTLLHLVEALDVWLQQQPSPPSIADPSGSGATFDHRWNESSYRYFRERMHAHAAQIRAAYNEADKNQSVAKWQTLFGDGFRPPIEQERKPFIVPPLAPTPSIHRAGRAG